jgi:hypothetical protein
MPPAYHMSKSTLECSKVSDFWVKGIVGAFETRTKTAVKSCRVSQHPFFGLGFLTMIFSITRSHENSVGISSSKHSLDDPLFTRLAFDLAAVTPVTVAEDAPRTSS